MRLSRFRNPKPLGMNMTPMIDIVFLLIIFFMTVSQITQSLDEPVDLPNVGPDGRPLETVSITINLNEGGRKVIAGRQYEMKELMQAVRRELGRVNNQADQVKILIRCDRNCPGKHINELSQELGKAGISRVRLSVQGHERK